MSVLATVQLASAFGGSVGFAMLFTVQRRHLFWAGIGGVLSWSVYLLLAPLVTSEVLRFFVASMAVTLYAEPMARLKKVPSTVFLVPAVIPMVPGASLYQSMRFAVEGRWAEFSPQLLYTLLLAGAIAAGIVYAMAMIHIWRKLVEVCRSHGGQKKHSL